MISVIVTTRDRHLKIKRCIIGLVRNKLAIPFEIIVVDQSTNKLTERLVKKIDSKKIKYVKMSSKGKSKALNLAIKKARGDILAFTDDDCIVNRDWLKNILLVFKKNKKISGVFGVVLPDKKNVKKNLICPAIFEKSNFKIFSDPKVINYREVGFGNNMSFKKKVLKDIGDFKEWLGPGTFIRGGEDCEIIFRALKMGYILAFSPYIIVRHNKWITKHEYQLLQTKYTCGVLSFCFYYILLKDYRGINMLRNKWRERLSNIFFLLWGNFKRFQLRRLWKKRREVGYLVWELLSVLISMLIVSRVYLKEKFDV